MSRKIALVTGANRGIGFEACRLVIFGMPISNYSPQDTINW